MKVINNITCFYEKKPDNVFISCASFEERCLGVPRRLFKTYRFKNAFIFVYDHPNEEREKHLQEMEQILNPKGLFERIITSEDDPIPAIGELTKKIKDLELQPSNSIITLDITTFTKRHLVLLLKMIDDFGLWRNLRIFYTKPKDYVTDLYLPMSIGIRSISPITGLIGHTSLSRPTLLVIFLGYEGDRAKAIYENFDPNDVLLIVPKPAYHSEWEGRTEEMNKHLIKIIGKEKIRHADSQNSLTVSKQLEEILIDFPLNEYRCSIASLGTKPQTLGIYLFWRNNRGDFSIIYAQPLKHNERFFSKGIDKTLLLMEPKNQ